MPDCKDKNITTPVYTEATPPPLAKGCSATGNLGISIIPPPAGGVGNITEVLAGQDIAVDNNSYPGVDSFTVHYNPFISLTTSLDAVGYIAGALQSGLILLGRIIDEVRLTWSYNKGIALQTLTNDGGFTDPTLIITDRDYSYLTIVLSTKTIFTIQGNDGLGQSGSIAIDTANIDFGNYVLWGDHTDMVGQADTDVAALVTSLLGQSTSISNTKSRSVFGTGGANRYFFYLLPKRLGEVIFSKNNFVGGFYRLKLVSNIFKTTLVGGDVETDVMITNSAGFTEAYYLYQSSVDNQNDSGTPFIIT